MTGDLPRCSVCDAPHDPRPCARDGEMCACCRTIYRTDEDWAAACAALAGAQ